MCVCVCVCMCVCVCVVVVALVLGCLVGLAQSTLLRSCRVSAVDAAVIVGYETRSTIMFMLMPRRKA